MTRQRGFSLVEALIALVVLSIGLIGVAAMQLKALQSANAGYQRSARAARRRPSNGDDNNGEEAPTR